MIVDESDMSWIENLWIWSRGERLKKYGKQLITVRDAEGKEVEERHYEASDDEEPSVKGVMRLRKLERMGFMPAE